MIKVRVTMNHKHEERVIKKAMLISPEKNWNIQSLYYTLILVLPVLKYFANFIITS